MKPYYENEHGKLYLGDCLEVMPKLGVVVDMVLCDPPYEKTRNKWDAIIPFKPMWDCIWGTIKNRAAVVLTASQPFTSALTMSQILAFKYADVWEKSSTTGHLNCKIMPLRGHEDILVFGNGKITYNPQIKDKPPKNIRPHSKSSMTENYGSFDFDQSKNRTIPRKKQYPKSIIKFNTAYHEGIAGLHPTQKPVDLFSYLIKTYSNQGETVLDFTAGSGTTAVAAEQTGRKWLLIEKEEEYCEVIADRLSGNIQKKTSEQGETTGEWQMSLFPEMTEKTTDNLGI